MRRNGVGCSMAKAAHGVRTCACFASRGSTTGRASSNACARSSGLCADCGVGALICQHIPAAWRSMCGWIGNAMFATFPHCGNHLPEVRRCERIAALGREHEPASLVLAEQAPTGSDLFARSGRTVEVPRLIRRTWMRPMGEVDLVSRHATNLRRSKPLPVPPKAHCGRCL